MKKTTGPGWPISWFGTGPVRVGEWGARIKGQSGAEPSGARPDAPP